MRVPQYALRKRLEEAEGLLWRVLPNAMEGATCKICGEWANTHKSNCIILKIDAFLTPTPVEPEVQIKCEVCGLSPNGCLCSIKETPAPEPEPAVFSKGVIVNDEPW